MDGMRGRKKNYSAFWFECMHIGVHFVQRSKKPFSKPFLMKHGVVCMSPPSEVGSLGDGGVDTVYE